MYNSKCSTKMLPGNLKVRDEMMWCVFYFFINYAFDIFTVWRQLNTFSLECLCKTRELFVNTLIVLFVERACFLCDDTKYFLSINKCWILTTGNDTFYVGRWQLQVSLKMLFSSVETIPWKLNNVLKRKWD